MLEDLRISTALRLYLYTIDLLPPSEAPGQCHIGDNDDAPHQSSNALHNTLVAYAIPAISSFESASIEIDIY